MKVLLDLCDRCNQFSQVRFSKGGVDLSLCGHHSNSVILNLISWGWKIEEDVRDWRPEGPEDGESQTTTGPREAVVTTDSGRDGDASGPDGDGRVPVS